MRRLMWATIVAVPTFNVVATAVLLLLAAYVWAQSIPPGATVSCEQNLEQARSENIALRKQLAQTMFQAAALEEQGMALRKQVDAANARDKAAEKK